MQRVIELARVIRERHFKPIKSPLRQLVVVHSDQAFLDDLAGAHIMINSHYIGFYSTRTQASHLPTFLHEANSSTPPLLGILTSSLDLVGELNAFVVEELNVREVITCCEPLKYATVRAEPQWQVRTRGLVMFTLCFACTNNAETCACIDLQAGMLSLPSK